jgi:hypothetical protein
VFTLWEEASVMRNWINNKKTELVKQNWVRPD